MRARSVGKLVINYGFSFVGFEKWLTIMLVDVGNRVGSFVALAAWPQKPEFLSFTPGFSPVIKEGENQ